jgi:nucleotide-binding universal stress UspA family protein
MFRRILVALDGSPASARALQAAVELAVDQRALLLGLHVIDELDWQRMAGSASTRRACDSYVEALHARVRSVMSETVMTDTGGKSVAHAILEQARVLRADVIVVGTHGRRGLRRLLLGSDAEGVLREARIPVLVVRVPERMPNTRAAIELPKPGVKHGAPRMNPALRIESSQ